LQKISYTQVCKPSELREILNLQSRNLKKNLTEHEIVQQGFVTVVHDLGLLSQLNEDYPHVIAKFDNQVIGYALIMLRKFEHTIPVLKPMFEQINLTPYKNGNLGQLSYFIMGQVCIDKAHRGKGVFAAIYKKLAATMQQHFDFIITEIAFENKRSLKAHSNVGFSIVHQYVDHDGIEWCIVIWDIG